MADPAPENIDTAFAAAVTIIGERWLAFTKSLPAEPQMSLRDKIAAFNTPMRQGLRNSFPIFQQASEPMLLMLVARGIAGSKSHTHDEVEAAIGAKAPD